MLCPVTGPIVATLTATCNRHSELFQLLQSLELSTLQPKHIIIVDSSDDLDKKRNVARLHGSRLRDNIIYVHHDEKSLALQKNKGLEILEGLKCDVVQILDDDVQVEPRHLEVIVDHFLKNPNVVGIAGVASEHVPKTSALQRISRMFAYLVGLDSPRSGCVTSSGIGVPVNRVLATPQESSWLFGCSAWRIKEIRGERYHMEMTGASLFEDVHFSTKIRQKGTLIVLPFLRLRHLKSGHGQRLNFEYWRQFQVNRIFVLENFGPTPQQRISWTISSLAIVLALLITRGISHAESKGALAGLREGLSRLGTRPHKGKQSPP